MEWKNFKDHKPDRDIIAVVANEKGFMSGIIATYYSGYDVWVTEEPKLFHTITLEVTHYIEIPGFQFK